MNTYTCEWHSGSGETLAQRNDCAASALLMEVDFKWLMAGQGCWIDPDRLHADPLYASGCLQAAINSRCDALRRCARFLQELLCPRIETA